jgi:hypothetical protein
MRAYTVTHPGLPAKDGDTKPFLRYAGKQSDAADIKRDLWEEHRDDGKVKRNDIAIDEIEIPTDKAGLISWINDNLA